MFIVNNRLYADYKQITMKTIWNKSIQNNSSIPWLDWIECGIKKYEGRLLRGDWKEMKINDEINFVAENKILKTRIIDLIVFENFSDAFDRLGSNLVPICGITSFEVTEIYSKIFEEVELKASDYKVIAVGIEPIR